MIVKNRFLYIILILLNLITYSAFAQTNCEVPLPPELTSVSIIPETSTALLNWTLSPSSGVSAYIVYLYDIRLGNPGFFAIDTIWNPSATTYSDTRIQFKSFQYRIAAFRAGAPRCPSELSNVLSTIFAEAAIDTCKKEINISWNKYTPPSPQIVTNYTILMSLNGGSYTEAGSVTSETTRFTISNFTIGASYCFRVAANISGGVSSISYRACLTARMQTPPGWINADYATINEGGGISLSFSVDPVSEIDLFALDRRQGYSGVFNQIALIPEADGEKVIYTDNTATRDAVWFYRLSAVNSCNIRVIGSNIASNMDLAVRADGNNILLQWNRYRSWNGQVASYRIFMDTGNGFAQKDVLTPSDTTYAVFIPEIMYNLTGDKVCFYVSASETGNPYGITGESASDTSCISIDENVTVPNIFSPDGDGLNDLFRPVITFSPPSYQLTITDRQMKTIFETRDYNESWDGSAGGSSVSRGVYLWFLKLTTPSGRNISRTGTVTIIKNR